MIERPSVSIDFTAGGNFRMLQSSGWSTPELHGVWSVGSETTVVVMGLRARVAHRVEILATPFVHPPAVTSQAMAVNCAGHELFSGNMCGPGEIRFAIPAQAVSEVGVVELTFRFPDAVAPRDVGASGDIRKLGFSLLRADFYPTSNETENDPSVPAGGSVAPDLQLDTHKDSIQDLKTQAEELAHPTRNRRHDLWTELDREVDRVVAGSGAGYPLMRKLVDHLECHDRIVAEFARATSRSCGASIMRTHRDPLAYAPMPRFTHRIWLTADDAPALPPEDFVGPLLRTNLDLPTDATHFFWSNSVIVREHIQRRAAEARCFNVAAMDIGLFRSDPLFDTMMRLMRDRKFPQAADVLRFLVVHRFGGIYADLGGLFDAATFDLVCACDYSLTGSAADFIQTGFIAATPQSDLTGIFLAILNTPHALSPAYALLGSAVGALDELNIFGGPGFTVCALLFLPPWARTIISPMQSRHMHFTSQQSWYGTEPKHGNVLVAHTGPSALTDVQFREAEEAVAHGLKFFGHDPILREKLRILLLTAQHFDENPTRFCEVFASHGSDRALGWHNYGFLYNYILGAERDKTRRILEIGTSHPDVPSAAGASLRAWRELFPLATVAGGIDNERALFRDERIETYFVDRRRPETLDALLHQLGDAPLDLVLDSGVMSFEFKLNVYRAIYPRIRPGGFLVIEDVRIEDVPRWAKLLAAADHMGAIVQLPHPKNHIDNCLVLIPGRTQP